MTQHSRILSSLHMKDASTGWALSPIAVLRTIDGGMHWKAVLPFPTWQGSFRGRKAGRYLLRFSAFHSATIATVMHEGAGNATHIFHTSDGGQSWHHAVIDALPLNPAPTFVDSHHGWVLATDHFPGPDPASPNIGKEIAIFHTSNGGQTWQRIASSITPSQLETNSNAYGIVPFTASVHIRFVTTTKGWLTGKFYHNAASSFCWLSVTYDGGHTWEQSDVSFPTNALRICSPTFFSQQDGLISLVTRTASSSYGTDIYVTHDGGTTWGKEASLGFTVECDHFLDMNKSWGRAHEASKILYTTDDGWQHWTLKPMRVALKNIHDISFVSPGVGWALGDDFEIDIPFDRKIEPISLLKTTNGGYTWQEIPYSFI